MSTNENNQDTLKRNIYIYFGCGITMLLAFCLLLHFSIGKTRPYTPSEEVIIEEEGEQPRFRVEFVQYETKQNRIFLHGWALIPEQEITSFKIHVLLRNMNTNQYLKIPTALQRRPDINRRFNNLRRRLTMEKYRKLITV